MRWLQVCLAGTIEGRTPPDCSRCVCFQDLIQTGAAREVKAPVTLEGKTFSLVY